MKMVNYEISGWMQIRKTLNMALQKNFKFYALKQKKKQHKYLTEKNSHHFFCVWQKLWINCRNYWCVFLSSDLFLSSIENVKFPWLWSKATTAKMSSWLAFVSSCQLTVSISRFTMILVCLLFFSTVNDLIVCF